jgi:hypothetical protein
MNQTVDNTQVVTDEATAAVAKVATTSFHFKSTQEIKARPIGKNEANENVFDEAGTKLITAGYKYDDKKGWKRPSIEVALPSIAKDGIISVLEQGGQGEQFLLAICNDQFYNAARQKINEILTDNQDVTITAATIKGFNLDWTSMAAAYLEAAASAKATGIPKEVWDDFVADYVTVMLRELPQNGEEKIKNAAEHLKLRFTKCRSNKKMLAKLQSYLALWFTATSRQEEFSKLYTTLDERAKALLAADDEDSI